MTKENVLQIISSNITDNNSGDVTAAKLRNTLNSLAELPSVDITQIQTFGRIELSPDIRYVVSLNGDVSFAIPITSDDYAHSYEIDLFVGATAYSVAFPNDVVWVKDIEIEANSRYMISIDYNGSTYTAMYAKIGG